MVVSNLSWCCVTYQALCPEMVEAKTVELNKLKVPASLTAQARMVLAQMHKHCGVCGSALTEEQVQQPIKKPIIGASRTGKATPSEPQMQITKVKCPPPSKQEGVVGGCGGKGNYGTDENGIEMRCGRCGGTGELTVTKQVDPEVIEAIGKLSTEIVKKPKESVKTDVETA